MSKWSGSWIVNNESVFTFFVLSQLNINVVITTLYPLFPVALILLIFDYCNTTVTIYELIYPICPRGKTTFYFSRSTWQDVSEHSIQTYQNGIGRHCDKNCLFSFKNDIFSEFSEMNFYQSLTLLSLAVKIHLIGWFRLRILSTDQNFDFQEN